MDDFEILNRLFSSRVRTKLLKYFFIFPESSYFIRELARNIGEDAKNISRELNNLEEIGFLSCKKRGLQKFYTIRDDFPFNPGLKTVFLQSSGTLSLFENVLQQLEGIETAYMKEFPSSDEKEADQIRLLLVGTPDMAVLNDTVNHLIEKSGKEIVYRCYSSEETEERRRMNDSYILEVSAGDKII